MPNGGGARGGKQKIAPPYPGRTDPTKIRIKGAHVSLQDLADMAMESTEARKRGKKD